MKRIAHLLLLFLALGLPALSQPAQPHPFGGDVLDLVSEAHKVRSAAPAERQAAGQGFLELLYRDPFLRELGPKLRLGEHVTALSQGQFDLQRFKADAERALSQSPRTTADVGISELRQKLSLLEIAFTSRPRTTGPARAPPVDAEALSRHTLKEVVGANKTKVLSMERIPNARIAMLSGEVSLPSGSSREAVALDLYGRMLVNAGSGHGDLRAGLAHNEVGRAVLGAETVHPNGAGTSDVLKGVGPTPYANNRFNSKATGTFPLPEAVRDWQQSETLRKAGVAIYEPVAIVELPYMEWSESEGWRPIAVYVRRGRENLRVSDLDKLTEQGKRNLVARLRGKIEAELKGVGRSGGISDADVIRNFVERVGRTAGIFQGGIGGGRYYFHGMLHDQNVSMLGEIMDVGNSDGVLKNQAEMRRAYKKSNYAWWPDKISEYKDLKGATSEVDVLRRLAQRYNTRLASATGGGLSQAEVSAIFEAAYQQGLRGTSAADPRLALTVRPEVAAPRASERLLDRYRRGDGTLDWKRMSREGVLREGGALAHFALALFLKEVAVVAATGDRARIEEFFDGLMTTDFYKHYGLFVAGARVSEVAYTRYLQRYVKPRFVNGVLKTNLVLAAGMALPLIAEGRFEGKAFAISVASLGLSSAAVKSGVAGIKWVMNLGKARQAGLLGNAARAGRLARLGGWFYTAAELAVILYVAETVDREVNAELARRQAREALSEAGQRLLATANASPSPERLREASEQYREAYNGYRDHLYQPLELQEAIFADRLQRYARQAKLLADRREAALAKVAGNAALERSLSERHGSLEAYAASLTQDEEAKLERELSLYVDSYNTNREAALEDVYRGNRREGSWLAGLEHREWLLSGAPTGASNDPFAERGDVFANWGRSRARSSFEDLLGSGSRNRLQTYEDEQELLQALEQSLRARGQGELARVLADERAKVARLAQLDRGLMDEGTIDTRTAKGIAERIEEVEAERGD